MLPTELAAFVILVMLESVFLVGIVQSEGFDVVVSGADLGNQGWVYQHIVLPTQNGYTRIAYVLTTPSEDGLGLAYEGTVADIRQGERGDIIAISLSDPQAYLYELRRPDDPPLGSTDAAEPELQTYSKRSLGALSQSMARRYVTSSSIMSQPN